MTEVAFSTILCQITFMVTKLHTGHTPYHVVLRVRQHLKNMDWTQPFPYQREGIDYWVMGLLDLCSTTSVWRLVLVPSTWALQGNLPFTELPVVSLARLKSANTAAAFSWDLNYFLLVVNLIPALEENEFCSACTMWPMTFRGIYF